jgi:hypothetical protein
LIIFSYFAILDRNKRSNARKERLPVLDVLRGLIQEQLHSCTDAELLDLIYKLLLTKS